MVEEVRQWTRAYRQLKKIIRAVTRNSLALIHGHVAARRAANRVRPRAPTNTIARPSRSCTTAFRN
jgi:hypothetical protein